MSERKGGRGSTDAWWAERGADRLNGAQANGAFPGVRTSKPLLRMEFPGRRKADPLVEARIRMRSVFSYSYALFAVDKPGDESARA